MNYHELNMNYQKFLFSIAKNIIHEKFFDLKVQSVALHSWAFMVIHVKKKNSVFMKLRNYGSKVY